MSWITVGLHRFLSDDAGQDLVEYALLTALVGISAIVTWQLLAAKVAVVYSADNANVQGLAAPADPIVPE